MHAQAFTCVHVYKTHIDVNEGFDGCCSIKLVSMMAELMVYAAQHMQVLQYILFLK